MDPIIIGIISYILAFLFIIGMYCAIKIKKKHKYKKILECLEIEKNVIECTPIMSEISKIKAFLKTDKLDTNLNLWEEKFENIKNESIPKITDMMIETEYSLKQKDYKSTAFKIAKLEMELYKAKIEAENLLSNIKEITSSEEKNRSIITKFKSKYRELASVYEKNKDTYGNINESIITQFENISKRFEAFEVYMENNDFEEVNKIIKAIDDMLKHMEIVLEEVPSIILIASNILPKKIQDISCIYRNMKKEGYPLDFLNVEYNLDEANKKIIDIINRTQVLNLEDSLFELKVLVDYVDSLFADFEKEKQDKKTYKEATETFKSRLTKLNNLIKGIFDQIEEIKTVYNLSKDNIKILNEVKQGLSELNDDYDVLKAHTSNNAFAYSKIIKEVEILTLKLNKLDDKLESSLDELSNMKEDEARARQQLEEIKDILRESKTKLKEFKFPLIPKFYHTELKEASQAIKEIVTELEKKPITIKVLNTRVDTARDLVLKLYSRTKELLKTAMCAETAIVYGNRYRAVSLEVNKNLTYSEVLFLEGEYQKSLEFTISALDKIEPGIYNRLIEHYEK